MSAALTFGFAIPFALVALILLVIVVLVDRRDEPDPTSRRPYAAYVFVVLFLSLFTVLFALSAMVGSLVHLAIDDSEHASSSHVRFKTGQSSSSSAILEESGQSDSGSFSSGDEEVTDEDGSADDAHIRDAVRAGILAAVAGAVLLFHHRLARRLVDDEDLASGPARRVYHAYLYASLTLAVIIVVGAVTVFGYGIFRVIAPGVASESGTGDRKDALPALATSLVLAAGAAYIFLTHYRRRPDVGGPARALPPARPAAPPPPPPPEEDEPPPRRVAPRPAPTARRPTAVKKAPARRPRRTE